MYSGHQPPDREKRRAGIRLPRRFSDARAQKSRQPRNCAPATGCGRRGRVYGGWQRQSTRSSGRAPRKCPRKMLEGSLMPGTHALMLLGVPLNCVLGRIRDTRQQRCRNSNARARRAIFLFQSRSDQKPMHTVYEVASSTVTVAMGDAAVNAVPSGIFARTISEPVSVLPSSSVMSSCLANFPKIAEEQKM